MAAPPAHLERSALLVSIAVTAVLSVTGVVWGIAAGSQMILLDGVYGFADAAAARTFAVLCLEFSRALVERRLTVIENLPGDFTAYAADEQPALGSFD